MRDCEALKDADTAEVTWSYCYFPDPYDVDEERHRSKLEFSTRWWFEHRQIASCTDGGRAFRRWLLWSRHSRPCVALGSRLRRQWPPRPMTSRKSNRLSP
jgi:hypothetical protein